MSKSKSIQNNGLSYDEALKLISRQPGHSRKSISLHYLR